MLVKKKKKLKYLIPNGFLLIIDFGRLILLRNMSPSELLWWNECYNFGAGLRGKNILIGDGCEGHLLASRSLDPFLDVLLASSG